MIKEKGTNVNEAEIGPHTLGQRVRNSGRVREEPAVTQHRLMSGDGVIEEERPENYLVRGLIDFDDISYDDHADLLYKLAGQVVSHLRSYLAGEDEVLNVLQYHQQTLVNLIHSQMQDHDEERATEYEAHVSKGFVTLRPNNYVAPADESRRHFRTTVDDRLLIRGMIFTGFRKCLCQEQKFDSDAERRFAVILENDSDVIKWLKSIGDMGGVLVDTVEEAATYVLDDPMGIFWR
ncbi:MAG: hypothetical protein QUV05_18180 [Phycisphaerae bacterium]|nr:hypothetical protein [Phycisphaerae bacterium]